MEFWRAIWNDFAKQNGEFLCEFGKFCLAMSSNPFLHAPTPQEDEMEKPFFGIRKSGFRSLWRVKNHVSRLFHDEKREIHRKIVPGIFGNDWVHNLVDFLVSF